MSEPTTTPRLTSIVYAIEAIESRLDACPDATVTPPLRAALDRLLAFPSYPEELPESYEPGYAAALKASLACLDRNMWVMENVLLAFVSDCEALGPIPDPAWLASLHASMLDYLRVWFGAYSREHSPDEVPAEIGDWSLCRLATAFQEAYMFDPADPLYRPLTSAELVAASGFRD